MFLSFLYPYPLRGRKAPYLWIAYKQVTDLAPHEVSFLCGEEYFTDPLEYRAQERFECLWTVNPELGFQVPTVKKLQAYCHYSLSLSHYHRLKRELISDTLVWVHLIKNIEPSLVNQIIDAIDRISASANIEAILTWCNYASITEAARIARIPIIHNELGPLRHPWYKPVGYFDFHGVNGNTEAASRFAAGQMDDVIPLDANELRGIFSVNENEQHEFNKTHEIGIPLQVEDDSNVLAYGRGFDIPLVVQYATQVAGVKSLLLRPHPGAFLFKDSKSHEIDLSPTATMFLRRCNSLLTLNSSMAVEAMLHQIPVAILGESPARLAAGTSLSDIRLASVKELDFLLLNYFVPYQLIFDPAYFRWRMTLPPEHEIRSYHINYYRQMHSLT